MSSDQIVELELKIVDPATTLEKVDALNALAFEIRNTDTNRAISLSKEAYEISSSLNYAKGKATALNNEAFCYIQITNYDLAFEKLLTSLQIFEEQKNE